MADRYWVGGASTTWNTTTHWSASDGGPSGASVPISSDNVFFTANSGSGFSVTLNVGPTMNNFTCTGCSVTFAGTQAVSIYGSVSVDSNVTFNNTGVTNLNASGAVNIGFASAPKNLSFVGNGTYYLTSNIGSPGATAAPAAAGQAVEAG